VADGTPSNIDEGDRNTRMDRTDAGSFHILGIRHAYGQAGW